MERIEFYALHLGDDAADAAEVYLPRLSPARQEALFRYASPVVRTRSLWGELLSRYLVAAAGGSPPFSLTICRHPKGKPYSPDSRFFFNWAHSGDWVLAGVGSSPLGVDVERTRREKSWLAVAERFFRDEEKQTIAAASEEARGDLFLRYWTMKESYLKYTGEGLSGGIKDVDVAALWAGEGAAAGRNFPLPGGAMAAVVAAPSLLPDHVTMISIEELRAGLGMH
ncbi:MAG: 4'-phosphopantetheinyl transferase family protein [Schwartzia sp. (in: firmicutes)]